MLFQLCDRDSTKSGNYRMENKINKQRQFRAITLQEAVLKNLIVRWHHNIFLFWSTNNIFAVCNKANFISSSTKHIPGFILCMPNYFNICYISLSSEIINFYVHFIHIFYLGMKLVLKL